MSLRDRVRRWLGWGGYTSGGYTGAHERHALVGEAPLVDDFPWMKRDVEYGKAVLELLSKDPRATIVEINIPGEQMADQLIATKVRRAVRVARGHSVEATSSPSHQKERKTD